MLAPLAFPDLSALRNLRVKMGRRAKKRWHNVGLEALENRVVLSYTFSYDPGTMVAMAVGTAATDSLVIKPVSGSLEYSVNGSTFSSDWGGQTVSAQSNVTVELDLSSGDGSSLQLGASSGAASQLHAPIVATVPTNSTDTLTIDDSASAAASTYTVDTGSGDITGPGFSYREVSAFAGGITLKGGSAADTCNILSTASSEPFTLAAGSSSLNVANVGNAGSVQGILGDVTVGDSGGFAAINIDASADTTTDNALLAGASPAEAQRRCGGKHFLHRRTSQQRRADARKRVRRE